MARKIGCFSSKLMPCILLLIPALCCRYGDCTPVQVTSFNTSDVTSSSCVINFTPVSDATHYEVKLTPRHLNLSNEITAFVFSSGAKISRLISDTIYYVTIVGIDSDNNTGPSSEVAELHTLPGAPTLQFSTPRPDSVFVFFKARNYARVSRWTVQYRVAGTNSTLQTANSTSGKYYILLLSNLLPDTTYEIQGGASQIDSTLDIPTNVVQWSVWSNFTTDSVSVFGRVIVTNVNYSAQHQVESSTEWNDALASLETAYLSLDHNGITIIRIRDEGGKPLIHYRLKVKDKTLPSAINYTISGAQFEDSYVNNGDAALGKQYIITPSTTSFTLVYIPDSSSSCSKIVERYMDVTQEGDGSNSTMEIHLNVASSAATAPEEDDTLFIGNSVNPLGLIRDDGVAWTTVLPNTVLALAPRFLVKDCLRNHPTPVSLYSELLDASNGTQTHDHFFHTTEVGELDLKETLISYTPLSNESTITLTVPALEKATSYEILNASDDNLMAKLSDLDGSDSWKIDLPGLTDGESYQIKPNVIFRAHNGEEKSTSGSTITIVASAILLPNIDGCVIVRKYSSVLPAMFA